MTNSIARYICPPEGSSFGGSMIDDDDGDYVDYSDYAELESKFAAQAARIEQLTAENAYIKNRHQYIRALAVCIIEHSGGRMDWRRALEDARGLCQAVDDVFQSMPATDAALREIQARAVESASDWANDWINQQDDVIENIREYAKQIRSGEVQL